MAKFDVSVSWRVRRTLEIEADTDEEAREKADQWCDDVPADEMTGEFADEFEIDAVDEVRGIMRYEDWEGDLSKFLRVGDLVDEGFVDHFLNTLPPLTLGKIIQMGEPFNQVDGKATYPTLERTAEGWMYMGNCFRGKTESRGGL